MRADRLIASVLPMLVRSTNGWLRGPCPFCSDINSYKKIPFGYNVKSNYYHCFKCQTRGRLHYHLVQDTQTQDEEPKQETKIDPPEGYIPVSEFGDAICFRKAKEYLETRGVHSNLCKELQIGACSIGKYSNRVVVPVLGLAGEWRGWITRTWLPKDMTTKPYLNCPGSWASSTFFNIKALDEKTSDPILVVEGVFDAIYCWPHAVAVLGKPGNSQLEMLLASPRPICFVLDGDAWQEAEAYSDWCRFQGHAAGAIHLGPKVDPDEIPLDDLLKIAKKSILV